MKQIKSFDIEMLLLVLASLMLFMHIEYLPIRQWDEARNALNAYEMSVNGKYLVMYYDGVPDMWNTKPPLLIWFQLLFLKMFGYGELSVRLPSAIFAFITCGLTYAFTKHVYKNRYAAMFATLVLLTSAGFVGWHAARFGDFDSLLTMFTTIAVFSFYRYMEDTNLNNRYLLYTMAALALAVFTKGVAGVLFAPAFFLYALCKRKIKDIATNKAFWTGCLFFIIPLGFYFLREQLNPGYIEAVIENEFVGRYVRPNDMNGETPWFYFLNLAKDRFNFWYLLLLTSIVAAFFMRRKYPKASEAVLYCALFTLVLLLVISKGSTKLYWYDMPVYPLLAVACGFPFMLLYGYLQSRKSSFVKHHAFAIFMVLAICAYPFVKTLWKYSYKPGEHYWDNVFYEPGHYLRKISRGDTIVSFGIMSNSYHAQLDYYTKKPIERGSKIYFVNNEQVKSGQFLMVPDTIDQQYLENHFTVKITDIHKHIKFYEVGEKKQ